MISVKPVKKVGLFCNARDEKHIREWAAHHLLIGFDHIIIFDHNSIVPISTYFGNFDKRVIILRYSTLPGQNNIKKTLMNKAIRAARLLQLDWFIYLDADEFIILNNDLRGVKDLLNRYYFADSLAINWLMFGTNHLKNDPNGLILDNYTKSELFLDKHVKSFVRPFQAIQSTNPHFYNIKNKKNMCALNTVLNPNKEPYSFNTHHIEYTKAHAFIAHHVYQSEETYVKRKVNLPSDNSGTMRPKIDIDHINSLHNANENIFPKLKYAENIKKFLQQYGHKY